MDDEKFDQSIFTHPANLTSALKNLTHEFLLPLL